MCVCWVTPRPWLEVAKCGLEACHDILQDWWNEQEKGSGQVIR